jgi:hypothetical protein
MTQSNASCLWIAVPLGPVSKWVLLKRCVGWLDVAPWLRRHELTDEQWQAIAALLPVSGAAGRPRIDDRRVINAMLFKARTGVAWRNLPER